MKKTLLYFLLLIGISGLSQDVIIEAETALPGNVKNHNVTAKIDGTKSVIVFNDINAYFELSNMTFPKGFSYLVWMKLDMAEQNKGYTLISHAGYNNELSIDSWHNPSFTVWLQDKIPSYISSSHLELGHWYFLAATYNSGTGEQLLYVNGVEVAGKTLLQPLLPNSNNVYIGVSRIDGVENPVFLKGVTLGKVIISKEALSADRIRAQYNAEKDLYK